MIQYVTIASTGDATDFGDLSAAKEENSATSNGIRAVNAGGEYHYTRTIDYVTIASTGNSQDFGDLTTDKSSHGACSEGHGGLG